MGGIRRSGYGREWLGLGIKEFVNHKLTDIVDIDAPSDRLRTVAANGVPSVALH